MQTSESLKARSTAQQQIYKILYLTHLPNKSHLAKNVWKLFTLAYLQDILQFYIL